MLLGAKLLDHFRFEEEIMRQGRFPRRNAHTAEHKRIERQLSGLLARIRELDGSQEQHYMLPTSFKPILIDLMVRHDLDYRSHLLHRLGR
jgi:hemerythrin